MGRPKKELDNEAIIDLLMKGWTQKEIAQDMGVSVPTLSKTIADLQREQGIIVKYRELQSLQLTRIQARILDAMTPEKIDEAPLRDLAAAYKILKDKEHVIEGKPSDIKGLVSYLIQLEKEESASETAIEDAEFEALVPKPDGIPDI